MFSLGNGEFCLRTLHSYRFILNTLFKSHIPETMWITLFWAIFCHKPLRSAINWSCNRSNNRHTPTVNLCRKCWEDLGYWNYKSVDIDQSIFLQVMKVPFIKILKTFATNLVVKKILNNVTNFILNNIKCIVI